MQVFSNKQWMAGIAALFMATACGGGGSGLAGKANSLGIDTGATIADQEKAEDVFEAAYPEVQNAVNQAISQSFGGQSPQQSGSQTVTLNESISYNGGTVTVKGKVTVKASQSGSGSQDMDVTVTWSNLQVTLNDGSTVTTEGKVVLAADFQFSAQGDFTGTASQVGQITVDGATFGFDMEITIDGDTITYRGTINGQTTEETINLSDIGGDFDDDDLNDDLDDITDTTSITTTTIP